jgi:hypothetical protein
MTDFHIGCIAVVILAFALVTYKVLNSLVTKSCIGCKRLKDCERRIKKLENSPCT